MDCPDTDAPTPPSTAPDERLHRPVTEQMEDEEATDYDDPTADAVLVDVQVCAYCFHLLYPDAPDDYYHPDVFWPCPSERERTSAPPPTAVVEPDLDADAEKAATMAVGRTISSQLTRIPPTMDRTQRFDAQEIARAAIGAYLSAASPKPAVSPDLDAIREARSDLAFAAWSVPGEKWHDHVATLLSALDEANRQIAGNAWFRTGHPLTEQAIIRINGLREYGPDMTNANAILDRLEDLVRMLGFDAEHANDILAQTEDALTEERRRLNELIKLAEDNPISVTSATILSVAKGHVECICPDDPDDREGPRCPIHEVEQLKTDLTEERRAHEVTMSALVEACCDGWADGTGALESYLRAARERNEA